MNRRFSLLAVASLFLLIPATLLAGGPPLLCLPIDGVTPNNVKACSDLLVTKLENKVWSPAERQRGIEVKRLANQWYVTFQIKEDIGLREVEAALQDSGFSVPRDKLRMFGHVILEIDTRTTPSAKILADLKGLSNVSVAKSEAKENRLAVTVEMPYPVGNNRSDVESLSGDKFQRNDFSSEQSTRSEPPITRRMLPSYGAFRDVVAKHNASLKDIRWSTDFACRVIGCVSVPDSVAVSSATR